MKPKFKVGQVVRINTDWYRTPTKRREQYQRITRVWKWMAQKDLGFGCTLLNGDNAHEKFLKALTDKERG